VIAVLSDDSRRFLNATPPQIGDGKAPGTANIRYIRKTSNAAGVVCGFKIKSGHY
jgi:hypothetical protein